MDLTFANQITEKLNKLITERKSEDFTGDLKVGVDLGTANIVIAVVDEDNNPIAGVSKEARVVKDGIVVDYINAVDILKKLKLDIESIIGKKLYKCSTAIPPGIIEGNKKVICNVVESAGFEVTNVVDEPTAAAKTLGLKDGTVVDVGGGTTGVSILKNGKVEYVVDEATGGTHMTLVLGGAYGLSFEEAEKLKRDISRENEVFIVIKPVIDKMASIVKKAIKNHDTDYIYVVGGACSFKKFEKVFYEQIGIKVFKPLNPLLITPIGIAMLSQEWGVKNG